ncbi:anti-anti-sigma factor [Lentzea xinjiangensis]|uniref:Anti-sigma factor antagonist n=1 Tax=Lentzea xinjiangensis TaxID=402600 RepID=A0A1H9K447_9PSEU|nr:STAS domain-containing protein [Lentzea xinjiangensis]SEQ93683.1 anti-anti-sigma factor [Lentzea xinjiangensis]
MTQSARRPLLISVRTVDAGARAPITSVRGEIDMCTGHVVDDEVDTQLATGPRLFVLDLTGVTFMGSTGVQVVLRSDQRAVEQRTAFALVAGAGLVRRVLGITGVDDLVDVHWTVPDALRAIG